MMFIIDFREKLRRSANRQKLEEHTAAQWQTLKERCGQMIAEWRRITRPTPVIQDQIWDFLYEYTQGAVTQILLRGKISLLDETEIKTRTGEMIFLLYPEEDCAAEISSRIRFISEQALAAAKPGSHDRYSPLDSPIGFRRMLGRHLWENAETVRRLKCCRNEYASQVIRKLHEVVYDQSQYESWEMRYLECERRYHQILNQIGEITRPAGTSIYNPRSAWELHGLIKKLAKPAGKSDFAEQQGYSWKYYHQLQEAIERQPLIIANRPAMSTKTRPRNK